MRWLLKLQDWQQDLKDRASMFAHISPLKDQLDILGNIHISLFVEH